MDEKEKAPEFQRALSCESFDSQGSTGSQSLSDKYNISMSIKLSSLSSSSNSPQLSQTTQLRKQLEKDKKFLPRSPTDAQTGNPCPQKMLKARYTNSKLKDVEDS